VGRRGLSTIVHNRRSVIRCFSHRWHRARWTRAGAAAFVVIGLLAGGASAGSVTTPSTAPAVAPQITADAAKLLDQVRDAYANLHGLEMAGTITLCAQGLEEQPQTRTASFSAVYGAPVAFRHSLGDSLVLANTPEKLYLYRATNNDVVSVAPILQRTAGEKLNPDLRKLLGAQNPSLLLALVPDAATELLSGATRATVEAGAGDLPGCRCLRIERADASSELMIDSTTHLLRQVRTDLSGGLRSSSLPAGAHVELLIAYTRDEPQKEVSARDLAWSPPAEAQAYRAAPPVMTDDEPNAASKLEGSPAPTFALNDADGKQVSLSDFKGSVVVLDFWAVWCGPCRLALPHLDKLNKEKAAVGVKVLAIDEQDAPALAITYLKQANLGLHLAFDADGTVGKAYMAEAIPETVVIGKDGVVRKVVVGYSAEDDSIEKAVDKALAE